MIDIISSVVLNKGMILTSEQEVEYRNYLINCLLAAPRLDIVLSSEWSSTFPDKAGVYLLWENDEIVYVGESGCIKGRMDNLRNTLNHQVRRNIARRHFSDIEGFQLGSSTRKHPEHIEMMLDDFLQRKAKVSFILVSLGRKEIEEAIFELKNPCYNNRAKRKN